MIDLTPIVQAVIALCAAFVTAVVIPYIKAKYTNEDISEFMVWVEIGVKAAEQIYKQTDGELKKQYVLTFLAEQGYKVTEDEVDKAIEAVVLEVHSALYGDGYEGSEK